MYPKTLSDSGVIRVELHAITEDEIGRAAQVVAACRSAAADGIEQTNEYAVWHGRAANAQANGLALGLTVNGGGIAGAILVLRDTMAPNRATVLACHSLWDCATTEPQMLAEAKAWAAAQGLTLGRLVHIPARTEWQAL